MSAHMSSWSMTKWNASASLETEQKVQWLLRVTTRRTHASSILLQTPQAGLLMHLFSCRGLVNSNSNFSRCSTVTWWWWLTPISLDNLRPERALHRHTCHSYRLIGWSVSKSATLTPSPKSDSQWYHVIQVWHLVSCNKERPVTSKYNLPLIISW